MDGSTFAKPPVSAPIDTLLGTREKTQAHKPGKAAAGEKSESIFTDTADVSMAPVYKSLTVLADEVIAKLEEILGKDLPEGIASLKPEDHTPEATAQRILDGTTALLGVYAHQHPELEGQELLNSFMKTIRGGIKEGYEQAMGILGDIGALGIDGVQSGIERTMQLVEEGLKEFEKRFMEESGLSPGKDSAAKPQDTEQSTSQDDASKQQTLPEEPVVA